MRSGGEVFSEQAALLLQWTSMKVVPIVAASASCTNTEPLISEPFSDLNISSIGVEQSFMGYSPVTTGPSRRRSNLSQTPGKTSEDKSSCFTNQQRQSTAARVISEALAVSLLFSSCLLFSEWLAVGGAGGETIAKEAKAWWDIFNLKDVAENDYENELLPVFCRLAVQSYRVTSDVSIIDSILVKCNISNCEKLLKQTLTAMLNVTTTVQNNSDDVKGVRDIIELVFTHAFDLFQKSSSNLPAELPDSMCSLFEGKEGTCCVLSFVEALFEHNVSFKQCVLHLIQKVKNAIDVQNNSAVSFNLQCLWLISETTRNSRRKKEIRQLVLTGLLSSKQYNDAIDGDNISSSTDGDNLVNAMCAFRDALQPVDESTS
jgi:hypothetical protein